MTDIVKRLRSPEVFIDTGGMFSPVAHEGADEIERLRKKIAVMEVDKSLEKAALTFGYVRQTFETGTGDFSKFKGINDD